MPLTANIETKQREPMRALKPTVLKAGQRVGLVSPASRPESPGVMQRCIQVVEQMGLTAVVGKSTMNIHGYMAGTDAERLSDLNQFFEDETIAAVFCTTGGFGSLHLLPEVNYDALRNTPKIILGCDENTALLNAITASTGLITFHGPNLDQINSRFTFDRVKSALMSSSVTQAVNVHDQPGDDMRFECYAPVPGHVEGYTVGGNLTAFISLLGTPYEPAVMGSIMFFEDKNEQHGILDRWMTTLYIGGFLQAAHGVAFGAFENCDRKGAVNMLSVEDTFGDRLMSINKVSCFGMPFGQTKNTSVIPLNVKASLDAQRGRLEFAEAPLL